MKKITIEVQPPDSVENVKVPEVTEGQEVEAYLIASGVFALLTSINWLDSEGSVEIIKVTLRNSNRMSGGTIRLESDYQIIFTPLNLLDDVSAQDRRIIVSAHLRTRGATGKIRLRVSIASGGTDSYISLEDTERETVVRSLVKAMHVGLQNFQRNAQRRDAWAVTRMAKLQLPVEEAAEVA